jgi:hypothetical protein
VEIEASLSFDTSAINALADDLVSADLTARIQASFVVRLTGTDIEEVIATPDSGRRGKVLDACQALLSGGECIQPFHIILERLVRDFDKGMAFEWSQVDIRATDYEREVIQRENIDDTLSQQQRNFARENNKTFADVFNSARPKFDELFSAGTPRPEGFAEFVAALQHLGGHFKPAIEGHFKTGQRTITLDELVLPYRLAVWQVQFAAVQPVIVRPEMPGAIPARHSAGPDSSLPLPSPEAAL